MVPSWLESQRCGLCLSRLAPGLQPEWVQVYNPCRMKTIRIAAYSVMYIPTLLLLYLVYYTLIFLPPSSPLPLVESDEVQGDGVSYTDLESD